MSVQQSILFQHLLKKLYAYSGTELSQGLSAMQKKKKKKKMYMAVPRMRIQVKKKKKKLSPIELGEKTNYTERKLLASPVNRKVQKLLVAIPSARVYLSPP